MVSFHQCKEESYLVPAVEEFSVRIFEEATNISATERHTSKRNGQAHGDRGLQVFPLCHVVTCPNCSVTLRSNEDRASQNEGSQLATRSLQHTIEGAQNLDKIIHIKI